LTDKDLKAKTELAIHGDTAAFEEICAAKRRELYITALTMLGSKEDAEDAVQDTMLSMYRSIGKLQKPKAFNSWIHRILHDSCVNIIRKKERQLRANPLSEEIIEVVADLDVHLEPERALTDLEMSAEVYEAIRFLPEKSREALLLYYFGDLKYREIAEVTGTSIKTVSTNLMYAKKILKNQLKEYGPEMAALAAGLPIAGFGAKLKGGLLLAKQLISFSPAASASVATGAATVACTAVIASAALAIPDYSIALTGDCDCGHINPETIELNGARPSDEVSFWALLGGDGETLCAGSLVQVTDYVQNLASARRDGHYTLRCRVTAKSGDYYTVSRNITIGNLDGDSA
jgi:RNA polymerase sigma-70 factor (ECF subfamily)